MSLSIVRLGTPKTRNELRLGTVRRPPRGVKKSDFTKKGYYDLWLPILAPSAELVKLALSTTDEKSWKIFKREYIKEMKAPGPSQLLDLLSLLSHIQDLSVGCYCEDESRCHRSILRELLRSRGAKLFK